VVPSCSIPTHLFLHCIRIICSFGSLPSQSQILVSLTSGSAWRKICSASSHPPARPLLHCSTANVIMPVFCAHFFRCAHPFLHYTCIVFQQHSSLRPCSETLVSADSADRQVDCLGEVLRGCTICPWRIPNVFRCLVNMGGPGCPVSLKFKIHCSDFVRKPFSVQKDKWFSLGEVFSGTGQ
jgi:hypothetical protein